MLNSRLVASVLLLISVSPLAAAPVPSSPDSTHQAYETLFRFLRYEGAGAARLGLLPLALKPSKEAVSFLGSKLKPVRLSEDVAKRLLADLDNGDPKVAEAAFDELSYFDVRLAMTPQQAFEIVPQGLGRQRLVALFEEEPMDAFAWCKLDLGPAGIRNGGDIRIETHLFIENLPNKPAEFKSYCDQWQNGRRMSHRVPSSVGDVHNDQWKQQSRALILLEYYGTPEAKKLIEGMTHGHPDAAPTIEAKAELKQWAVPLPKPDVQKAWDGLLNDHGGSPRCVLTLLKHKPEAILTIRANLRPIKLTADRCLELISALGDDDEKKWQAARAELLYLDPRLVFDLPALMEKAPTGLMRTRLAEILCYQKADSLKGLTLQLQKQDNGVYVLVSEIGSRAVDDKLRSFANPAWERVHAVLNVLEVFETPDAMKLIEEIASWHPKAPSSTFAKLVLTRMKKQAGPK
ncbi:hypothetical protein [Limnoglobus roseus]|uniref:HEAT repeat domain-containing protein n=1 Tax=Limnoglobus roseus TaxID=2598579 RepID=A0A5C1AAV4_9BACT|nr:hypothetical protein [Limnoglobus roseus]QEL14254.1 hypothetical protein PX52LOC_01124 [Limnoglobus roseus]